MESVRLVISNNTDVLAAITAAGGISVFLQPIKKWLGLQSEKLIMALLISFTFLSVAIEWLLTESASNPGLIGQRTAVILGLTQPLYHYFIKPGSKLIRDAKQYREATQTAKPNTEPTVITPDAIAPATPDDFKEV